MSWELKPHKDKLNNETFSIGLTKHLPNSSANLAYISSPEITDKDVSVTYNELNAHADGSYELYYANGDKGSALENTSRSSMVPFQDILITDEFSIMKDTNDTPAPLFYRATLKEKVDGAGFPTNNKIVPYQYGYILKTEEIIKSSNTSTDKSDVTPLVYSETYKNGLNNFVVVTDENGIRVKDGFKIRMIREAGNEYRVYVYNNFDRNKVYYATYRNASGAQITETLDSQLLFDKIPYDVFLERLQDPDYLMAAEYAIKQEGRIYKVYASSDMMNIDDTQRKPFEFKYRILANIKKNYGVSNPAVIKTGIIYLNNNVSDDTHTVVADFASKGIFPDYVSFTNPHPPMKYDIPQTEENLPYIEEYKKSPDYWDVDITAPQDDINDYDIIFITGYGTHDLSTFNDKFSKYLSIGGKLVIDSLSNDTAEALNISFGDNPIVGYSIAGPMVSGTKMFGPAAGYSSRYFELTDANLTAHIDASDIPVSPGLTLVDENSSNWQDIVMFNSGSRSIALKSYNGKGKIILSSNGILKGFSYSKTQDAPKFVVNMILTLAEDAWESTPWIWDRVYHKNQLYKHEYMLENYVTDISPVNSSEIIAKKIISSRIKDFVSYYTGTYGVSGTYHIDAYEVVEGRLTPLASVYMPPVLQGNSPIYAFATSPGNSSFDVTSTQGYEESNIRPHYSDVSFKVAITPFTFIWDKEKDGDGNYTGRIVQTILEAPEANRIKESYTISRTSGFLNLGLMSTMLPQLPSGNEWADRNKVFFRVEVSNATDKEGHFIANENRVNAYIYDKHTGEYIYTSDGNSIIPYRDLYMERTVHGKTRSRHQDIILQASTNYYTLMASKRVFAIKNNVAQGPLVMVPSGLNTNESWFPRIRRTTFIKTSFDKDDYDRISKTIGFRYDKEYILLKAQEYFGNNPDDDLVANVIAKLSNDQVVNIEDISILSEAFDLIDERNSYEYDVNEYRSQVWDDNEPYKFVKDEYAKYVNHNTIRLQYSPLHIENFTEDGEELKQLSPRIFKGANKNWLYSRPVVVRQKVGNAWETIDMDNPDNPFSIDYSNGMIVFEDDQANTIRATYTHSNINVIRKMYTNATVKDEELDELIEGSLYAVQGMLDKRVLKLPTPVLSVIDGNGDTRTLSPEAYTVDYDTGIVSLVNKTGGKLLMSYSYMNIEYIEVSDFDSVNGLLKLSIPVHFNDNIYVSYYYEENYYEYHGYYDADKGQYMYVDLNPTRGHECTYPQVENGNVVYKETPTYKLLGKTLYLYMLPYRIIKQNGEEVIQEITIRHTWDKEELTLLQIAHPEMIVLGNIKLMNNYTVYDVIALDTRKRGGGLKEDITNEKIERVDEASLNLWDISPFDGRSYHPNGIVVIKLPKKVLDSYTNDEVKEIVEKHLAFGVMPIIKYY